MPKILMIINRLCFFSLGLLLSFCFSENNSSQKYLSKETIDTSIMRGFLLLNESADMAGVGFRHEQSILQAKKIGRYLKEMARGDPNAKYILWKVSELEAQIYLEESDLLNQQMRKRQLTINELVDKYNKEVGKWRPEFATLYRIYKNMLQVDINKANELADSYNQRKKGISREVVYFLDKAILAGNVEEARKELGYCLRNQLYLNISQSTYKSLEERVEGLIEAYDTKPYIEKLISTARKYLDMCNITDARKCLDTADNKFFTIKQHLPQRESLVLSSSLKKIKGKLSSIEDSLVNVNISILKRQGFNEADKYLQNVLRARGVSVEKAAYVDRMIIATKTPEEGKKIASIEVDTTNESVIDNIMIAAKKKAKEKQDSLMLSVTISGNYENSSNIQGGTTYLQSTLNNSLDIKADSITMEIYNLLENNKIKKANELYKKEKDFLEKHLGKEELGALKSTLDNFTEEPPVASSTVYLVKPVEETLSKTKDTISNNLEANLLRAQKEIEGIYTMLEQNQIDRAYKRFMVNKAPLQKYLSPEAFNMLELSVTQAYQDYTSKKNKQGGKL
ncbi:MAG: hypothetical protein N2053_09765 [Chitinispirillaceae bacterium]|nr:hypothetical protein [Chitinispirillaceae bacterium]